MREWKRRLGVFGVTLLAMVALGGIAQGEEAATPGYRPGPEAAEESPSAANAAAMANLPAVWHDGPVTQMSLGGKLSGNMGEDMAIALAISQQLNDRVLVRGAISHAMQKEQTIAAATLILKW